MGRRVEAAGPEGVPEGKTRGAAAQQGPSAALVLVFAVATGALVANIYYAQPLVDAIAPEIGVSRDLAGSVVSVTQIGYGLGLFLFVSLADLVENRLLVLLTLGGAVAGLAGAALSTSLVPFFAASFLIGLCSTGVHVLLPYVVRLTPPDTRGRVIGCIMAGILTGIMLSRPAALFLAGSLGWRAVFGCSALLMLGIGLVLLRAMTPYRPRTGTPYGRILLSMFGLLRDMPILRRRALYQALLFCAFNIFWTDAPIMLAGRFGMGQYGIGLFALVGAVGALSAPYAGRLADRGLGRLATACAMSTLTLSFGLMGWAASSLAALVVLTIAMDCAIQVNQIVSQRIIFAAPAEMRGRVNAIYMTILFGGGAAGSVLGTLLYHWGGWDAAAWAGALIGLLNLVLFATEKRSLRAAS